MAGLTQHTPHPTQIVLHQQSKTLEVSFDDGKTFNLSFELLRVESPSAEVKGHHPSQAVLQTGKRDVSITSVDTVGHYAIQPLFSDGHQSGIYSWDYLYYLGTHQDTLWQAYLDELQRTGQSREPNDTIMRVSAVQR